MPKKKTFEMAMERLQQIVEELEGGNLPLEEAQKKFEEGIKLSKFCSQKLEETEKKIAVLTDSQTGWSSEESTNQFTKD
jgi:exodeoxyribonuclease VII small subunit